jgi:PPK2 family polyphosphate:nucleotide phosphotransferase
VTYTERFMVCPGESLSLADWDARQNDGMRKKQGKKALYDLRDELNDLQELLYASQKYALLILLQGMDTSGKDGVIKRVVNAFNPQGCEVTSFKAPTEKELAHDFVWRVHRRVPRRGMVGIHNRSHYEDVLVVRVESLFPERVWRPRYEMINHFEELLAHSGVVILKFFLHISLDEQKERLERRLANSHSHWKFRLSDLYARSKWDEYMRAYEEALSRCSSEHAPWFVIPADRKWYRNLVVSNILLEKLRSLDMEWPTLESGVDPDMEII